MKQKKVFVKAGILLLFLLLLLGLAGCGEKSQLSQLSAGDAVRINCLCGSERRVMLWFDEFTQAGLLDCGSTVRIRTIRIEEEPYGLTYYYYGIYPIEGNYRLFPEFIPGYIYGYVRVWEEEDTLYTAVMGYPGTCSIMLEKVDAGE